MYIKKIEITNIRSIEKFEMQFDDYAAGWHVVIGDNGSGKSSVVRSISAVLIGPDQIPAVLPIWDEWLRIDVMEGRIHVELNRDSDFDNMSQTRPPKNRPIVNEYILKRNGKVTLSTNANQKALNPNNFNWGDRGGWFSVAYGPYRRFTGGDAKWNKVYYSAEKAGAHLSVFGEDIALTEALDWLKELDRKRLKQREDIQINQMEDQEQPYNSSSDKIYNYIKKFINQSGLLPHGALFDRIDIDGEVVFVDGNGNPIKVIQMSDGYRSILSLTFELIRQLVRVYGYRWVFKNVADSDGNEIVPIIIDLPGVVLIDEIDAHLHPSWQTRIGQWFTKYFPNIQFIVTTHSPLICRACDKGSIWRLASPGSDGTSGKISDKDKNILINGNVLDAYGTAIFGENVTISVEAVQRKEELVRLKRKKRTSSLSNDEEKELIQLKVMFPEDDTINL